MTYSLAQVRAAIRDEFRILAEELEAEYATRDTNDGSTYCSNCGGPRRGRTWRHDPECTVAEIRKRIPRTPQAEKKP